MKLMRHILAEERKINEVNRRAFNVAAVKLCAFYMAPKVNSVCFSATTRTALCQTVDTKT